MGELREERRIEQSKYKGKYSGCKLLVPTTPSFPSRWLYFPELLIQTVQQPACSAEIRAKAFNPLDAFGRQRRAALPETIVPEAGWARSHRLKRNPLGCGDVCFPAGILSRA